MSLSPSVPSQSDLIKSYTPYCFRQNGGNSLPLRSKRILKLIEEKEIKDIIKSIESRNLFLILFPLRLSFKVPFSRISSINRIELICNFDAFNKRDDALNIVCI